MDDIDDDVEGNTVLNKFFKVLDAEFGTDNDGNKRVKRQARSITVDFPSTTDFMSMPSQPESAPTATGRSPPAMAVGRPPTPRSRPNSRRR